MSLLSKNKLKLLKLFYTHPKRQFYIQEIGRLLKKKPGTFQRALESLHKNGLLSSEYKANARFSKSIRAARFTTKSKASFPNPSAS